VNLKLSELRGRPVLDIDTATTLGEIDGAVVNSPEGRIAAFTVAHAAEGHNVLPWDQIKSVGPDAVTVEGAHALRPPDDPYERGVVDGTFQANGKKVLTTEGDAVGEVADVILDPDSGAFVALLVDGKEFPASQVLAIGDFAAIVQAT
jgi:uncharacterized protein YrrD